LLELLLMEAIDENRRGESIGQLEVNHDENISYIRESTSYQVANEQRAGDGSAVWSRVRCSSHTAPEQFEGCTWVTSQVRELSHIHSREPASPKSP